MTTILAIDPGQTVGWACSDGTFGAWDLAATIEDSEAAGLCVFAKMLGDLLDYTSPEILAVEAPFIPRAGTRGLQPVHFYQYGIAVAAAWRAGVATRALQKGQAQVALWGVSGLTDAEVKRRHRAEGWAVTNNHASDAITLCRAIMKTENVG